MTVFVVDGDNSPARRAAARFLYAVSVVAAVTVLISLGLVMVGAISDRKPGPGQQMSGEGALLWLALLVGVALGSMLLALVYSLGRVVGASAKVPGATRLIAVQVGGLALAVAGLFTTTRGLATAPTFLTWLLVLVGWGIAMTASVVLVRRHVIRTPQP